MQNMVDALHPTYVHVTMVGLGLVAANAYHYQDVNMVIVNQKLFSASAMTYFDGLEHSVINVRHTSTIDN